MAGAILAPDATYIHIVRAATKGQMQMVICAPERVLFQHIWTSQPGCEWSKEIREFLQGVWPNYPSSPKFIAVLDYEGADPNIIKALKLETESLRVALCSDCTYLFQSEKDAGIRILDLTGWCSSKLYCLLSLFPPPPPSGFFLFYSFRSHPFLSRFFPPWRSLCCRLIRYFFVSSPTDVEI